MKTVPEHTPANLLDSLEQAPWSYNFFQAVGLCESVLAVFNGEKSSDLSERLRFFVNPALSFPPEDVYSLAFIQDAQGDYQVDMGVNLPGLHGSGSPLPSYMTEFIAQYSDESPELCAFFDIFNHRLIQILYSIFIKYRYYLQFERGALDDFSNYAFSLIGLGHITMRGEDSLDWIRLLPYSGILSFRPEAPQSLEAVLRHYFDHEDISIKQCILRWVTIPDDQRSVMGVCNATLGVDLSIGEAVHDQTGKFRIVVKELTWEKFMTFLPDGSAYSYLCSLMQCLLKTRLSYDIELRLKKSECKFLALSEASQSRLGWSSWCELKDIDARVVLEPKNKGW